MGVKKHGPTRLKKLVLPSSFPVHVSMLRFLKSYHEEPIYLLTVYVGFPELPVINHHRLGGFTLADICPLRDQKSEIGVLAGHVLHVDSREGCALSSSKCLCWSWAGWCRAGPRCGSTVLCVSVSTPPCSWAGWWLTGTMLSYHGEGPGIDP